MEAIDIQIPVSKKSIYKYGLQAPLDDGDCFIKNSDSRINLSDNFAKKKVPKSMQTREIMNFKN